MKKISSTTIFAIYTLVLSIILLMNANIDMSLSEKIGISIVILIFNILFENAIPLTISNVEFFGKARPKDLERAILMMEVLKVCSLILFAISLAISIFQLIFTFIFKEVTAFTIVLLMSLTLWLSFYTGAKKAIQQTNKLLDSLSK